MLLPLLALLQMATAVKQSPAVAAAYSGRENQTTIQAPRIEDAKIEVDGVLNEPMWQHAASLTGFSQYSPVDGRPAEDSTRVLVWYGPDALYLGIEAHEAHGAVNGTLANRDKIQGDDYIQILLDTFNDRRRAQVFGVNPLGVQADGILNEGTQARTTGGFGAAPTSRDTVDLNPDFVYQSKGVVGPQGYTVEVRIPFKSLRYQSGATQTWGINIVRRVQHLGAEDTWTPARRASASFLNQSGQLVGLTGLSQGLVLDINPVTTAKVTGTPSTTPGGSYKYTRSDPEFGGNVRWGITPNLTLNATANPDFSQVEADVQQVVIDPRGAISFPEKRPFFLEGSEQFEVGNSLVYTRRIVEPVAAVKMNGKAAGLSIGLLSGLDAKSQSLTPLDPTNPLYNIVRLKRDVGTSSSIGALITDKEDGDYYNRVMGVDARVVFAKLWTLSLQGARSFTYNRDAGSLWDAYLDRNGRKFGMRYQFTGIQPNFVTNSGFIRRGDKVQINLTHRFTWFGTKGNLIESISYSPTADWLYYYDDFPSGEGSEIKTHNTISANLKGGWRVGAAFYWEWFRYPGARLYPNYFVEHTAANGTKSYTPFDAVSRHNITNFDYIFSINTPQWSTFSANGFIAFGADENFQEWSQSVVWLPTINADWRPTEKIRVNGRWAFQHTQRWSDRSTVQRRSIPRLKVEYQMTRSIFFRVVGQYDASYQDNLRDDDGTNDPLVVRNANGTYTRLNGFRTNSFRTDYLFSYQPTPGTVIFAGYGSSLAEPESFRFNDMRRLNDGFFFKLSYLFRM